MHDYDVGVVALTSPPPLAVLTAYRPAVSVRNNGIHPALAAGTLRIYKAGLLIYTTEIYSGTIAPGDTQPAQAIDYWTPPALGQYMVIATVTCDKDQYEPNNNLAPTWITVGSQPPPPPPTVPLHAAQHEEDGTDEIIIDGLRGRAADPQLALAHKTSHQAGGADALDVTGLTGILATGQPIADHHETHENHGDDELNVDDLSGELHNLQKPKIHGNESHDPNYATDADFDAHKTATTAHDNRRDVAGGFCGLDSAAEVPSGRLAPVPTVHGNHFLKVGKTWEEAQVLSEKGAANGYAELDDAGIVPVDQIGLLATEPTTPEEDVLHADRCFYPPLAAAPLGHKTSHQVGGTDELSIAGLEGNPSAVGQASGIAPLDADSLVPLENLPPLGGGPHAATHENGGADEISIAGLSGKAANTQRADNLTLRGADVTVKGNDPETTLCECLIPTEWWNDNTGFWLDIIGHLGITTQPLQLLTLKVYLAGTELSMLGFSINTDVNTGTKFRMQLKLWNYNYLAFISQLTRDTPPLGTNQIALKSQTGITHSPVPTTLRVTAAFVNGNPLSFVVQEAFHLVNLGNQTAPTPPLKGTPAEVPALGD